MAQALRRSDHEAGARVAPAAVREIAVPPAARELSTLPRIDYEDAFLVEVGRAQDRTAEAWARSILDDAPLAVRSTLTSGWLALGMKLGSGSSDRSVLGWEIRRSTPAHVLLGAESRLGLTGELLLKRRRRTLLFCTFVRRENATGRALWAGVEPIHRPVVRRVLEQGAARAAGRA